MLEIIKWTGDKKSCRIDDVAKESETLVVLNEAQKCLHNHILTKNASTLKCEKAIIDEKVILDLKKSLEEYENLGLSFKSLVLFTVEEDFNFKCLEILKETKVEKVYVAIQPLKRTDV